MKLMWYRRWEKIWGRNEKANYPTRGDKKTKSPIKRDEKI
jgi:hypothetical protein